MESNKQDPTAFQATQLVDEIVERIMLYLASDKEPSHTAALGMAIADLKHLKRLVLLLENKEALDGMPTLELCNQLFLRMIKLLKKTNNRFPFRIYLKTKRILLLN